MRKTLLLLVVCLTAAIHLRAQFEMNAEIRPRAEFRRGYGKLPGPGVDPAFFVSQRTRINMLYTHEKFRTKISFQDVRVWGDGQWVSSTGNFGENASIDLNEGWIELNTGQRGSVKIGRQYWSYDEERILAARNWNQSTVKYDALLYTYSSGGYDLHLGLSYNNSRENVFGNDYNLYNQVIFFDTLTQTVKTLEKPGTTRIRSQNFLYLAKRFNSKLEMTAMAIATGIQKPTSSGTMYVRGTYGWIVDYASASFRVKGSAYYQNGKNLTGQDVDAYMFNLKAELKGAPLSYSAGIDYLSGQNVRNQNETYRKRDHFFDIFYGARHKYYGFMDYFNNMPVATAGGGLVDVFGGFNYRISPKTKAGIDYHYFSLQSFIGDQATGAGHKDVSGKSLGSEIDVVFDIHLLPEVNLKSGFSLLFPTENMEKIQGIDPGRSLTPYWIWCMLTVKPDLIPKSKISARQD